MTLEPPSISEFGRPSLVLPDYQRRRRGLRLELWRKRNTIARSKNRRSPLRVLVPMVIAAAPIAFWLLRPAPLSRPIAPPKTVAKAEATPKTVAPPARPIRWKTVWATAYCARCRVCETTNITYTGRKAHTHGVAVARTGRRAAKLGSEVLVPGHGWLQVDDVGGGVGGNQIDIRVRSHAEAVQFGRRQIQIGLAVSPRS